MFFFVILVIELFVMNSVQFKRSPGHEYPTIELEMTNFMENLSDEYVCGKTELSDDSVQTNSKIIDCKTEKCTDLGENFSVSGLKFEREEKVRKFEMEFVVFCD